MIKLQRISRKVKALSESGLFGCQVKAGLRSTFFCSGRSCSKPDY